MDDTIILSNLNDFIFCPASIYFHSLYGKQDTLSFQTDAQINGTKAHKKVDDNSYSTRKDILTSLEVYSGKYRILGKIDIYNMISKTLIERKKQIKTIYDGYIFQLYGQYFAMKEMGYEVQNLKLYSMDDNKNYKIPLPENNPEMLYKFENIINEMRTFSLDNFVQTNGKKCQYCIYEPSCDRALFRG